MTKTDIAGVCERLLGPHEWGYRCPVEGGFIEDTFPFEAAAVLKRQADEINRLRHALVEAGMHIKISPGACEDRAERIVQNIRTALTTGEEK